MAYRDWLNKKYGFAQDFTNLKEHDDKYHGGSYDPKTQRCKLRQRLDKDDAEIDSLTGADKERADKLENEEAMAAADKYLRSLNPNDPSLPSKWRKNASEPVHLDGDGKPYEGMDWDIGRMFVAGKPVTGPHDGAIYFNGYGFKGKIAGKYWKGGRILDPTFQSGGTKSKYRLMRNRHIADMIEKDDGTFDLETGEPVSYETGYQLAFQTTDSEKPGKPTFLTDEEYDAKVDELARQTGSKPHLGNFDVPEISFRSEDLEQAKDLAFKKYNQHSIWNWEKMDIIENDDLDTSTNSVKS